MIYELFYPLKFHYSWLSWLNVLRYIPFRTIMATITAMLLTFVLAPWFIRELRRKQIGQVVRDGRPGDAQGQGGHADHGRRAHPALAAPARRCSGPTCRNPFVLATTAVTAGYGVIGYLDDYLKIKRKSSGGLAGPLQAPRPGAHRRRGDRATCSSPTTRLPADWLAIRDPPRAPVRRPSRSTRSTLPLWVYMPFAVFVVVATSNAVNLTDGLDGLAIGPVMINAGTYLIWAYVAGVVHRAASRSRRTSTSPRSPPSASSSVYCGSVIGAGIGFLWYNTYPAQVFMGDVGSLALGGGLGMLAVCTKNELLAILLGGIFFIETVSVITQVVSFKLTGKRIFLMAPIHHHYEKKGWAEPKIIVRFWIISILLALVSLASLKLR